MNALVPSFTSALVGITLLWPTELASALAAQSPDASPTRAEDADERTRDLNRVLHLVGGGTLRGRARWTGEHWEIRRDGAWSPLPAGAVERVVDERELLREAQAMSRAIERADWPRRVGYAEWLWRAGLVDESFAELERALAVDPDQREALALLSTPPTPIRAPGDDLNAEESVKAAATAPASLAEVALARFAARSDRAEIETALRSALSSHSVKLRQFAARGLRRMQPGEAVREMLSRAVLDGSENVRREASLALRDTRDEAVLVPVLRAMSSSSAAVRNNASDALGHMGYPAAVLPLVSRLAALSAPQSSGGGYRAPASHIFVGRQTAYVQDYDVEVAQFASVADPQVNILTEGSVLDVRVIGAYATSTAIESRHIRSSLSKLTGADPGDSNRAWLAWWDANKSQYERKPSPEGATAAAR